LKKKFIDLLFKLNQFGSRTAHRAQPRFNEKKTSHVDVFLFTIWIFPPFIKNKKNAIIKTVNGDIQ